MGRIYAGILGPLALTMVVVRGLRDGGGAESTMMTASLCLLGFASIGYAIGQLAQWIVDGSVRTRIETELAERPGGRAKEHPPPAVPRTAST